eukprot:COSAG06_NODE_58168_length_278_cov_0.564246_2_plen_35_part_01
MLGEPGKCILPCSGAASGMIVPSRLEYVVVPSRDP